MAKWPDHYPDRCPPSNAEYPEGCLYRFVSKSVPMKEDFTSHYDINPKKDWGEKECQAKGLSVFGTIEDCLLIAARVPALRKKVISKAVLSADENLVADTPSNQSQNHKTLWSTQDADDLASNFKYVDMESA